jgi:hypothetical protein
MFVILCVLELNGFRCFSAHELFGAWRSLCVSSGAM